MVKSRQGGYAFKNPAQNITTIVTDKASIKNHNANDKIALRFNLPIKHLVLD
jgi:hypothetical protein